ncbi:MAG: helix-turn-helix transcriptional regulator [Acidobacteriaceae bacterium]|nr:helix-turn-helix transcriptional regulator [Acidobacteriaceae bacterium]
MEEAGQKLRRFRERLGLRYRDVEEASQRIANERGNHEFLIGLSRLADIENKGTVPSVYRLYSLCAIYALDFSLVLSWYGIELQQLPAHTARLPLQNTHAVNIKAPDRLQVDFPAEFDIDIDLQQTSYLARHIRRWGRLPVSMLDSLDLPHQRYGFIGTADWSMYPILRPGSFVQIDETRRKIARDGWTGDHDRPIYFLEHRDGYLCGWCSERAGLLVVQPHSGSNTPLRVFRYPGDAEIIGQIVAVAMRLDPAKRRRTRS